MNHLHNILQQHLPPLGLDLIHHFPQHALQHLSWHPTAFNPSGSAFIIGNTKALWAPFLKILRQQPNQPNPLDTWITTILTDLIARHSPKSTIFWAHQTDPSPIPIQNIATASGMVSMSPAGLCAHPTHGPWIALRAVILSPEPMPQNQTWAGPGKEPCASCKAPCTDAFAKAQRASAALGGPLTQETMRATWRSWVAIREVCPIGRSSQYSEAQLRYHYLGEEIIKS